MIILILLASFFTDFRHPDGIEIYQVVSGDKFYDSGGPDGTYINCTTSDQCTSTSIICGPGAVSLYFNTFYLTPSLSAYSDRLAGSGINSNDRRLINDNIPILDNQRVGCPQIYGNFLYKKTE